MRILHTSDWHIGRTFHGTDLLPDQAEVLAAIARLVREQSVDVVVIPGDIYDRAIPSADAITVCNNGFEEIRDAGAVIVATSGNHDSPTRLGAGSAFSAAGGLHLLTSVSRCAQPVVLPDSHGEVAFYGIPYLEPDLVRAELGVPHARSHADMLAAAMELIHADLAQRGNPRSVVLAHAFVTGAEAAGSERTISVGGVETVPLSLLAGIDYVALGHLHSPQTLAGPVRYSGSPLPYSFGERSHQKAVWLADIGGEGLNSVTRLDLPEVRGLSQLAGKLDDLLTNIAFASAETHYVSVTLTDATRPADPLRQLRSRFPHAVHVEWVRPQGSPVKYRDKVRGRSDVEIARSFLSDVRSEPVKSEMEWVTKSLAAAPEEGPAIMEATA